MVEHEGRQDERGVTLIEVMIVTAIIGVLAVLATVGYSRWIRSSKMAEATNMLGGIRNGQENYFSQTGRYLNVSSGVNPPSMYPRGNPNDGSKTPWYSPVSAGATSANWDRLGVKSDGPVYFGYATVADGDTCDPACRSVAVSVGSGSVNWVTENGGPINKAWYVATAQVDSNANGVYAKVIGMSFNSRLIVDAENE